ncbi:MAG TPA: M48 family metalloprotease [Solirubrobacteraceae bacterium]|nr:M48 family metalloprotease [Solirubrobacteraceae bacterium]
MRNPWRLPIALVTTVVVAQAAVVLMRPRDRGPDPVPVPAGAYFSPAQITRAEAFRTGQTWLGVGQMAIGIGALVLLVRRPPERLMALKRPVVAGAATAAALAVIAGLAPLPLRAIARERAKDVGLVTQDWVGWAGDVVKAEAISAVFAAAGGALLVVGMRRTGRRWWIPGAAVVVAFAVVTTYAGPVVLEPMFNTFTPLPQGELRRDVLDLARRAGVDVGQVYEMDASRRTTAANAYVGGIGHTKRVVLYDTLIEDFTPAETRLVVAHELGHVHHHDLRNGLIWVAIVAPFGMWAAAALAERLAPRDAPLGPRAIPAVALSLALLLPPVTWISNQLSRDVERRADAFSLELTRDPRTFTDFERRITTTNVSDPDPPKLVHLLFGTHPTALQRIGQAEAFAREATDPGRAGAAPPPAGP